MDASENLIPYCPQEILNHIFSYLNGPSLAKCKHICSRWKAIASDQSLWKLAFTTDFKFSTELTPDFHARYQQRYALLRNLANAQHSKVSTEIQTEGHDRVRWCLKSGLLIIRGRTKLAAYNIATGDKLYEKKCNRNNLSAAMTLAFENLGRITLVMPKSYRIQVFNLDSDKILCKCGPLLNIWRIATGECLFAFSQLKSHLFHSLDNRILFQRDATSIEMWDFNNHTRLWQVTDPNLQGVSTYKIQDNILLLSSPSGTLMGYDLDNGKLLYHRPGPENNNCKYISIINKHFFVSLVQHDTTLWIHDLLTGEKLDKIVIGNAFRALQRLEISVVDGNLVIPQDNCIEVWDLEKRVLKFRFEKPARPLAPNETPPAILLQHYLISKNRLIAIFEKSSKLCIWDLETGKLVASPMVCNGEFTPAGIHDHILCIQCYVEESVFSKEQTLIKFIDLSDGSIIGKKSLKDWWDISFTEGKLINCSVEVFEKLSEGIQSEKCTHSRRIIIEDFSGLKKGPAGQ